MADHSPDSLLERQLRELLAAIPGLAGEGSANPGEATNGIPQWEARTRDQRFAEKARTHGYPLGLAKGTLAKRDRLLAAHHQRVGGATAAQRAVYDTVHEALAWALDAERFLGSFNRREGHALPSEAVDAVTDHLLVWLRERGCTVVPIAPIPATGAAPAELTLSYDLASGMLLDPPAHATYERILRNDLPFETPAVDGITNAEAAAWANALALSTALPGELPPPVGHTGQFGRHGCVLVETTTSSRGTTHDVCCFVYQPEETDAFFEELVGQGTITLIESVVSIAEVVEFVSGLHPLSRSVLDDDLARRHAQVPRRTNLEAALAWGRAHADRLRRRDAEG